MAISVQGVVSRGKGEPVQLTEVLVPEPGPGEALVRVQACGVCHTDLHYKMGGIGDDYPYLLGHEAAGVVEAVGDDVTDVAPGDFVILNWRAVCGQCRACKRGRPWYCFATHNATQKMTLADGTPLSPALGIGAFAEKTLVAAGQCTKVEPGDRARDRGAARLRRDGGHRRGDQHRRRHPRRHGRRDRLRRRRRRGGARQQAGRREDDHRGGHRRPQARVGPRVRRHPHDQLANADPVEGIRELTGGFGADVVVEAIGRPETYKQAFFARDLAGVVVLVGVPTPDMQLELPLLEVFGRGGALKSSWYGDCLPSRDFPMLVDLHLDGRLPLEKFVSETIGLGDIEAAFTKMEHGEVLRSVVVF